MLIVCTNLKIVFIGINYLHLLSVNHIIGVDRTSLVGLFFVRTGAGGNLKIDTNESHTF